MACFVMVHGAWHGGWCFEEVERLLVAKGHRVIAPTLPGMQGDRPAGEVSLSLWADFVAAQARAQDEPVMLCGHSRGGIVVSAAAEQAPEAVAALVYITAFLLPDGQSLRGLQATWPEKPVYADALSPTGDGTAVLFDPQVAGEVFYNRCSAAVRQAAVSRLVPEPVAPLSEAVQITAAAFGRLPRNYIECSDDRVLPVERQREMQAQMPCERVITLDADHSPFLSCPQALSEALVGLL